MDRCFCDLSWVGRVGTVAVKDRVGVGFDRSRCSSFLILDIRGERVVILDCQLFVADEFFYAVSNFLEDVKLLGGLGAALLDDRVDL